LKAYDSEKYNDLNGYADDIIGIANELSLEDIIFVGHSVSAMMGLLAAERAPHLFKKLILVGPSASYINDGEYVGGFSKSEVEELLDSLKTNHMGWSMTMAPMIMANPERAELTEELSASFCRTDPAIAQQFARVTFMSDSRSVLSACTTPALIIQCSNDIIAPVEVGEYIHRKIAGSELVILEATGHCPHLSAPEETILAIKAYL